MSFVRVMFGVALVLAAACSRRDAGPPPDLKQRDPGPTAEGAATSASTPADTSCPKVGNWALCSVLDRLERAGMVVTPKLDADIVGLFQAPGTVFTVGGGEDELHVFLYPTVEARRADTDLLDSVTVSPKGARRSYRVPPLLVTSNNLAAIVLSRNERTSERLSLALSAGLPPVDAKR